MANEFADRIKKIELELTALKTASPFTSIRNVHTVASFQVSTGVYQINYQTNGEPIISEVLLGATYNNNSDIVVARTPGSNSQLVDVDTTYEQGGSPVTYTTSMAVVSNVPVTSIVRL